MSGMNTQRALPLIGSLVLLLAPSCIISREYVNEDLEPGRVEQLVPGTSTASDVVALLGAPAEVVQLGRRSAYRYEHAQEKVTGLTLVFVVFFFNSDMQSDRVWVFFDENDVLTHMASTFEAEEAEYAMPWVGHD